jgi:hypothetical protein
VVGGGCFGAHAAGTEKNADLRSSLSLEQAEHHTGIPGAARRCCLEDSGTGYLAAAGRGAVTPVCGGQTPPCRLGPHRHGPQETPDPATRPCAAPFGRRHAPSVVRRPRRGDPGAGGAVLAYRRSTVRLKRGPLSRYGATDQRPTAWPRPLSMRPRRIPRCCSRQTRGFLCPPFLPGVWPNTRPLRGEYVTPSHSGFRHPAPVIGCASIPRL